MVFLGLVWSQQELDRSEEDEVRLEQDGMIWTSTAVWTWVGRWAVLAIQLCMFGFCGSILSGLWSIFISIYMAVVDWIE